MKPPPFRYAAPTRVEEVLGLLAANADDEPRVLAGGQSLVPLMNFRLAQPGFLVDLRLVEALTTAPRATATCSSSARWSASPPWSARRRWRSAAPLLAEALGYVAHPPIRNSGTVGGSLAHADPSAELPAVALALDAELVAAGPGGTRAIPAAEFFRGPFTTALEPDEILTEVRVPRREGAGGHAFVEFARTHGNFALVGVAAHDRAGWDIVTAGVHRAERGGADARARGRGRAHARRARPRTDRDDRGRCERGRRRAVPGRRPARQHRRPGSTSPGPTCAAASSWRSPAPRNER